MKKTNFIPQKDRDVAGWAANLAVKSSGCCGTTDLDLTTFKAATDDFRAKVTASDNAQALARQATFEKQARRQILEGLGRAMSRRMKAHPDYTKGIGVQLGIEGSSSVPDLRTSSPDLTAINKTGGTVELRFTKHGSDGVNFNYQKENDSEWIMVGRGMVSQFQDIRPLLVPGKPEMRRYTSVYMKKDQEVSLYSEDIVITCTP